MDSVEAELVAMMIGMGFFALTGKRLQMVVPPTLSIQTVKDAVLRFIQTQDNAFLLHPEQLLATMSRCEAQDWQRRLAAMDENHRIADRERALGNFLIPARAELSELSPPALLSMMPKVTNMKNPTEDEVRAEINRQMCFLEREGFLTSSVDSTGKVWWEKTEKWADESPISKTTQVPRMRAGLIDSRSRKGGLQMLERRAGIKDGQVVVVANHRCPAWTSGTKAAGLPCPPLMIQSRRKSQ